MATETRAWLDTWGKGKLVAPLSPPHKPKTRSLCVVVDPSHIGLHYTKLVLWRGSLRLVLGVDVLYEDEFKWFVVMSLHYVFGVVWPTLVTVNPCK